MQDVQTLSRTTQGEFSWADLAAADIERQSAFYEGLFGWTHQDIPTDRGPDYRMFFLGGARVAGGAQMTPEVYPPGTPSTWNTYIYADDVDKIAARVTDLGGRIFMPAMDVMQEGRMAGIVDPSGGMVFFWQPGAHAGAQVFDQPGALIWHDLNTRDPEHAADFFSKLLGWQTALNEDSELDYHMVMVNGRPEGGIMQMPPQLGPEVPPHWLVYFGAADVEATCERAEALGGKVVGPPMTAGPMHFAVIADPEDAPFAIMTPLVGM